ncbi:MAG TPA: hypothetical protein VLG39_03400 [Nitrospirota bacterium]|nr:hypothetical protein [Nitrospirota bacterium]
MSRRFDIKARDLPRKWRDDGVLVISGFHSPLEKECLNNLLRGRQPAIICAARNIEIMRIRAEFKAPLADGRCCFSLHFRQERSE